MQSDNVCDGHTLRARAPRGRGVHAQTRIPDAGRGGHRCRAPGRAPALITRDDDRPGVPCGVATGDVTDGQAIVWSRTDRPARLIVEYSTDRLVRRHPPHRRSGGARGHRLHRARRPHRPAGRAAHLVSRAVSGSRRSAPLQRAGRGQLSDAGRRRAARRGADRDVSFVFSGDCVGQGWGIDPSRGGMRLYDAMRQAAAGRVHPPRRHDLRRPAAASRK